MKNSVPVQVPKLMFTGTTALVPGARVPAAIGIDEVTTGVEQAAPPVWVKLMLSNCAAVAALTALVFRIRICEVLAGRVPDWESMALSSVGVPTRPRSRVWPATTMKLKAAVPARPVPAPAKARKRKRPVASVRQVLTERGKSAAAVMVPMTGMAPLTSTVPVRMPM